MVSARRLKRGILRGFFVLELLVFGYFFVLGTTGLRSLWSQAQENEQLEQKIVVLKEEVDGLHNEIDAWEQEPFKREEIARNTLHMARPGEMIYIVDEDK